MPTGMCVYCTREVELRLLKKCGACGPRALFAIRGVTYCSKECQKLSWKLTHKYTCVRVEIPPEKEEALKHYGKIINGWYSLWSEYLDHFALMALDLANNPGKNTTHCMWLELLYTGQKEDCDKFEIYRGCVRAAEEVLAENPQLQIMRDPPPLAGKRIRHVTVFRFEEEGKPRQIFLRARTWELPESLEPWKNSPAGWEPVYKVLQKMFPRVEEGEEIVFIVPADAPV